MSYDPIRMMHIGFDGAEISQAEVDNIKKGEAMTTPATSADAIWQAERDEAARHVAIDAAVKGWQPRANKVLLATLAPVERRTESGLHLPGKNSPMGDKVERKGRLARVVAAGPDATVEVGTRVYCSSFAGALVEIDGHSLLVIAEDELLLVEDGETVR
jgi:co-chaperonin GroES (HSP10)